MSSTWAGGALSPSAAQRLAARNGNVSTDPAAQMAADIAAIRARLAPDPYFYRVQLIGLGENTVLTPQPDIRNQEINQLVVSLSQGTVNIYTGTVSQNNLLYQFSPSANPIFLPIFPQVVQEIIIQCDTNSTDPAIGIIDFICS